MSRRLTNDDRNVIRKRLIEHAFTKREEALAKAEHVLAAAAYDRIYPKKIRDAMAALPKGFLNEESSVWTNVNGQRVGLTLAGNRPVMKGYYSDTPDKCLNVLSDDALGMKILAHAAAEKALKEEISKAKENVRAALSSMTTVKQCIERWPEARTFVEDLETKPSSALAIPLRDLNKTLGLPPA